MSYITTYQKIKMDPLHARAEEINVADIAHSLSLLCRANGHIPHFYSVAQHCLNCMEEAKARGYSERVQLGCLLHDASEAYLSDITRPIKPHLNGYYEIEERLQTLIFNKWLSPALTEDEREQIFAIDDAMLYHEFMQLVGVRLFDEPSKLSSTPILKFIDFAKIEQAFRKSFEKLTT